MFEWAIQYLGAKTSNSFANTTQNQQQKLIKLIVQKKKWKKKETNF